jgi:hypothetical protein
LHAQNELEHVQKLARRERNNKWKPVFQELKRKVRERNARLKEHQKRWKAIFKELKQKVEEVEGGASSEAEERLR